MPEMLARLDSNSPLSRTDLISDFALECRRAADGSWRVAGFQIKPDGSSGPRLGAIGV
jgi:hypothetical protein